MRFRGRLGGREKVRTRAVGRSSEDRFKYWGRRPCAVWLSGGLPLVAGPPGGLGDRGFSSGGPGVQWGWVKLLCGGRTPGLTRDGRTATTSLPALPAGVFTWSGASLVYRQPMRTSGSAPGPTRAPLIARSRRGCAPAPCPSRFRRVHHPDRPPSGHAASDGSASTPNLSSRKLQSASR